jgi:hypothetical protein
MEQADQETPVNAAKENFRVLFRIFVKIYRGRAGAGCRGAACRPAAAMQESEEEGVFKGVDPD